MTVASDGGAIYRAITGVSIAIASANVYGSMTIVLPGEAFDLLGGYLSDALGAVGQGSVIVMNLPVGTVHVTRAT